MRPEMKDRIKTSVEELLQEIKEQSDIRIQKE